VTTCRDRTPSGRVIYRRIVELLEVERTERPKAADDEKFSEMLDVVLEDIGVTFDQARKMIELHPDPVYWAQKSRAALRSEAVSLVKKKPLVVATGT
jgi:hypothetical protein